MELMTQMGYIATFSRYSPNQENFHQFWIIDILLYITNIVYKMHFLVKFYSKLAPSCFLNIQSAYKFSLCINPGQRLQHSASTALNDIAIPQYGVNDPDGIHCYILQIFSQSGEFSPILDN